MCESQRGRPHPSPPWPSPSSSCAIPQPNDAATATPWTCTCVQVAPSSSARPPAAAAGAPGPRVSNPGGLIPAAAAAGTPRRVSFATAAAATAANDLDRTSVPALASNGGAGLLSSEGQDADPTRYSRLSTGEPVDVLASVPAEGLALATTAEAPQAAAGCCTAAGFWARLQFGLVYVW